MSQISVNQINPVAPSGTVNFSGANPPTWNGTPLGTGGSSGGSGGGPASGYVDPRPVRLTPPAPTDLVVVGAFRTIILSWSLENYINHAFVEIYRNTVNDRTTASLIGKSTSTGFNDVSVIIGTTYYYWVRAVNIEAASGSYNSGVNAGISGSILKIGNTDLGTLVVEAGNLADGSISAAKLAPNAISSLTQFASGLEPIAVVASLPSPVAYTGAKVVFLTTDGKLYRYTGSAWVTGVIAADMTGTIGNSQISGLDAAKLSGTLNTALLAAGAIDATKLASSIGTITIVSSVPGVKSTDVIFNTTDRKLYRWNGTAYIATTAAADISGTLTNSQLADLDAAKLTGTLNVARIAANALDATKFANGIEPITIVNSVPGTKSTNTIFNTVDGKLYRWNGSAYVTTVQTSDLSGTISSGQIADGSIAGTKLASGIEAVTIVSSVPGAKVTNLIFNTTDGKLYRWTGVSYTASIPGADVIGSVSTVDIADGSIGLTKFASGIEPFAVVSSVPGVKSTNTIFNTTDGKIYRWNGTSYTAAIIAADITVGQITGTQIADGSISTPKLVAGSINANVLSAGTITSNLMTANSISGDRILANSLDAGKIVAGTITASQIAAAGITGDKIAANTITADKLQANSITAAQIAANTITTGQIASNTITAGNIAAATLTSTQIAAGGITGDRIAAGSITADRLQANSITTTQIAAGSINGDRIAADSITAGQIATGAISASELAANAVTTNKLLVTGKGSALNDDPSFTDSSAWVQHDGVYPTFVTGVTTGVAGTTLVRFNAMGAIRSRDFNVSVGKTYRVRIYGKKTGGIGPGVYIRIEFKNSSGAVIQAIVNDYNSAGIFENISIPSIWTTYSGYAVAPAEAVKAYALIYSNYPSDSVGITEFQDFRCDEYVGADLIVDGAITTQKMTANSINGDRILANSLSANKIVAGSITTDRFTANTIGGSILQDGTITANKLVANSITSGQIQAGAINAAQIAAGAITASKLTVVNQDSVYPDPGWYDSNFLFGGGSVLSGISGADDGGFGWPATRVLKFQPGVPNCDFQTSWFPIELGASYRFKVYIFVDSAYNGTFGVWTLFPQQSWFEMGIPRTGTNLSNGLQAISVTRNIWHTYTTSFTNNSSIISAGDPNSRSLIRFYDNGHTAGNVYLVIEMVRASSADLIVDGAVTTNKMTANSINGDRITTNTLNANKILANSITAGQIQAGAIGATQIAAGAITTGKLVVTGNSDSIWIDRNFEDVSAWTEISSGLMALQATVADGVSGNKVMRSPTGSMSAIYGNKTVPTTIGKRYKASIYARKSAGANGTLYFRFNGADTTSTVYSEIPIYTLDNISVTTSWVKYSTEFVATALFIAPSITLNWNGTAGYMEAQDIRIEEMIVGSDLIVDGTITATKLQAGTITAGTAVIANGAITNALIGTAAIDAAKIADLSVTNAKIADATIQAAKISTVNADSITTGTLAAGRIAAGSIDASKLNVTSLSAISAEVGNAVISTSGSIRSGQTAWNTGTGWWWGIDSGTAKMSIGDPSGAFMRWTGAALELTGATLVNPVMSSFSVTFGGAITSSVASGIRTLAIRTATPTGGTAPYSYTWSSSIDPETSAGEVWLLNTSTATVTVKGSGASGDNVNGTLTCTVVDSNGRVATAAVSIVSSFF